MRSLADVFRWAALPAALRALPAKDREIFLNAATVLLDLDPRTKEKPRSERSAILRGDLESPKEQFEAVKRLEQAIINVGKDIGAENWGANWDEIKKLPEGVLRRRGRRVIAANIIRKVLRSPCEELTFARSVNLLFLLQKDVTFDRDRENGKNDLMRFSQKAELERLERAAATLRLEEPDLKKKSRRAKWLREKNGFHTLAPNPKALIECARRNGIEI